MSGILAGLVWAINQPDWTISKPEQVQIEGNQYLSDTTIRSMLAITYPQLILELSPAQLKARLTERSSITNVSIDRQVLPPRLTVQVQDFPPVARIVPDDPTSSLALIDERGWQLPTASYRPSVVQSLPTLQLRLPTHGTCPEWSQIYRAVRTSPVAIGTIDCRNPQNVTLQTEIGKVGLGAVGNRLKDRMQQLDRLRNWQKQILPDDVELLDLENPDFPKLQLKQPAIAPVKPGSN
jgi:cell division protein FtsQ